MPRPYANADADQLSRHGLVDTPESQILVNESRGVITSALQYAEQPFETAELGMGVARIEHCLILEQNVDAFDELLQHCLTQLRATDTGLISCRLREDERQTIAALHRQGFGVIECLLTLGRDLPPAPTGLPAGIDRASQSDADDCAHIAATSFQFDRFHADRRISSQAADNLKAAWARNACHGRADTVFVMRDRGRIIGFNACRKNADTVEIDLIGVLPERQGQGIGQHLVTAVLAHYAGQATRVAVGTQSANIASLALYQGAGFKIEASSFTLHKHLGAPTP